jgi:hypothetical protein
MHLHGQAKFLRFGDGLPPASGRQHHRPKEHRYRKMPTLSRTHRSISRSAAKQSYVTIPTCVLFLDDGGGGQMLDCISKCILLEQPVDKHC